MSDWKDEKKPSDPIGTAVLVVAVVAILFWAFLFYNAAAIG